MLACSKAHSTKLTKDLIDHRVDIKSTRLIYLNVDALILASRHIIIGYVDDLCEYIRGNILTLLLHIGLVAQIY